MIRGTTPTHIFTIPFDTSQVDELRISYAQNDVEKIVKTKEQCTLNGNKLGYFV